MGDQVSLLIPNTEGNNNQQFTVSTAAKESDMSGQVFTWEGSKTVYALYPLSANGYTFNTADTTILFDNTSQEIDATAGNKYPNGLMVAVATDATATSQDAYSIGELNFKQVMSLFELEVKDIPEGEQITAMGFEIDEALFVASADINPTTGEIVARTTTNTLSAVVNNQAGTTASLNFSVLPVDLTGKAISLYVTTSNETASKQYKYEIAGGINFQANRFLYSKAGELSLSTDFTGGDLYLADFNNGIIPAGNKWIILDETAETANFDGLKNAIATLKKEGKSIALEFPNLTNLPNYALFIDVNQDGLYDGNLTAISCPRVATIGDYALFNCESLTAISFPLATTVGTYTFNGCTALAIDSIPLITSIGGNAFSGCSALTTVSFPLVTSIGDNAFLGCNSLTTISFPMATSIGSSIFNGCDALLNLEMSTGVDATTSKGIVLANIGAGIFSNWEGVSNEGNITLTIGRANQPNIKDNTLTVTENVYTFKKIIIPGTSDEDISGSVDDGIAEPW